MAQQILLVALGSAIGGSFRYLATFLFKTTAEVNFTPTLLVNVVGSFLIGIGFVVLSKGSISEKQGLFLLTGILGGFTTFSGYSLEIFRLLENGQILPAISYALGSVVAGLLAAAAGIFLATKIL